MSFVDMLRGCFTSNGSKHISVTLFYDINDFQEQLTHWGRDKMPAIFQKTSSNAKNRKL